VSGVAVLDDHVAGSAVTGPHVLSGHGNLLSVDRADGLKTTGHGSSSRHDHQISSLGNTGTSSTVVEGDLRGDQVSGHLDSLSIDFDGERSRPGSSGSEVSSRNNSCGSLDIHLIESVWVDGSASHISIRHVSGPPAGSVHHTGGNHNHRPLVLGHGGVGWFHRAIRVEQLEEREGPGSTGDATGHEARWTHGRECGVWELVGRILVRR